MDQNLFTLFDDTTPQEEPNNKSKSTKASKKKPKNAVHNNDLFLFEQENNPEETPEINNEEVTTTLEKKDIDSVEEQKEQTITEDAETETTASESTSVIEAQDQETITTAESETHTLSSDAPNEHITQEEAEALLTEPTVDNIEESTTFTLNTNVITQEATIEEQNQTATENDDIIANEVINDTIVPEEEEKDETEEQVIEDVILPEPDFETKLVVDNTIIEVTPTEAEELETKSIDEHLLGEIIATDYSMFLENEASLLKLEKKHSIPEETTGHLATESADDQAVTPSLPEWELSKKYYTIGEVAQLFEVNTSHIRFWSKEFSLRLRTTRKGDRLYTTDDINKLRLIHELVKVKKHTIKGAKEILQTQKNKIVEKVDLKDNLKELKSLLLGIHKKL